MTEQPKGEIIIYSAAKGRGGIEVKLQDETVWLNQAQMAELFNKDKRAVSEHIRNIFKEKELSENSVVRNFRTVHYHQRYCEFN